MTIPSCDVPGDEIPSVEPAAELGARPAAAPGRHRRLATHFIIVLLGSSGIASMVGGAHAGISAALGVALAGANLFLMQRITSAMTAPDGGSGGAAPGGSPPGGSPPGGSPPGGSPPGGSPPGGNAAWALALPFKLVALVGVAYGLVSVGVAQPVPLAIGFALLPLTGVFLPRPGSVPDLITSSPVARSPVNPRARRRRH